MKTHRFALTLTIAILSCGIASHGQDSSAIQHTIAAIEKDRFHGWPANNGIWQWGDEILVGFTQGEFVHKGGHNIGGRENSLLSRSTDGGQTWTMFDPAGFLDDDNQKFRSENVPSLEQPLDFLHQGFALRIFSDGYHGNADPRGGFFYSYDRGTTWRGPFTLNGLASHPELQGKHISARTDYLVQSQNSCLIFISAHGANDRLNRVGCVKTTDGGRSFQFLSWVTPPSENVNAVMSQTIQFNEREFVLTYRKIHRGIVRPDCIEACRSDDGCQSWNQIGTVKTMKVGSNPPALVQLQDGRLCCAYGDRYAAEIRAKYSQDQGRTWGPEFIIRDDFHTTIDDPDSKASGLKDLGYVRMVQRPDRKLVALYYWATLQHPQQHIAVSIWNP